MDGGGFDGYECCDFFTPMNRCTQFTVCAVHVYFLRLRFFSDKNYQSLSEYYLLELFGYLWYNGLNRANKLPHKLEFSSLAPVL